jgi:hypothetical protein
MKIRFLTAALLLCVSLLMVFGNASAQNQRIGSAAASELLIPVGARDIAMGGSTIATSEGLEAIYWNPAGLGRMRHSAEGMFSWMQYIADIKVNYGAVASKFGDFGTLGLSLKALDFGDIPLTTVDDPEGLGGKTYSPTYVTIGLTYGRALTDAIAFGLTGKLFTETIGRVSASGFALDFGVQYNGLVGISGLQVGVAVKNIGPQLKYGGTGLYRSAIATDGNRPQQKYAIESAGFELPSLVEIGISYAGTVRDNMMYQLNSSFSNNNLYLDEYRVGGEYGIKVQDVSVFARAGYAFVPQIADKKDDIFGVDLGFGISYLSGGVDLSLDYAYRKVDLFTSNNIICFRVGF